MLHISSIEPPVKIPTPAESRKERPKVAAAPWFIASADSLASMLETGNSNLCVLAKGIVFELLNASQFSMLNINSSLAPPIICGETEYLTVSLEVFKDDVQLSLYGEFGPFTVRNISESLRSLLAIVSLNTSTISELVLSRECCLTIGGKCVEVQTSTPLIRFHT